ncbi:MAG: hypothetical protein ACF8SC_10420 [Phycisphaerales bacterium JB037]
MSFPLGVYPIEHAEPRAGYSVTFEAADSGEEPGEWEEWPDRYAFEVVVPAERLRPLVRSLTGLLPPRVYPILDFLGHDAYREIDPYIAYDLVGLDRFLDGLQFADAFLYEDGLCGFGAMCDDPFVYFFVDEHKILTVRIPADHRERAERVLKAFDLEEIDEPAGADSAAHEHRTVLLAPDDRPELLNADEVVERLRDEWALTLNIDPEDNADEEGNPLGLTPWRCVLRLAIEKQREPVYVEVLLWASCYRVAEDASEPAAIRAAGVDDELIEDVFPAAMDRLLPEDLGKFLTASGKDSPRAGERSGTARSIKPGSDGAVLSARVLA